MNDDHISRTLRYMEHLRLESYEASPTRARRLMREYNVLWASIEKHLEQRDSMMTAPQEPSTSTPS